MIQDVSAPIGVCAIYNHRKNTSLPVKLSWDGREYLIKKTGLHYSFRKGKTLFHVFTVSTESLFFKLVLNTDNLFWSVEQIGDNLPE